MKSLPFLSNESRSLGVFWSGLIALLLVYTLGYGALRGCGIVYHSTRVRAGPGSSTLTDGHEVCTDARSGGRIDPIGWEEKRVPVSGFAKAVEAVYRPLMAIEELCWELAYPVGEEAPDFDGPPD